MSLLTACMMVKNEEKMLPDCLESIREIIDALVIIDTGSTDKTVNIIKRFARLNKNIAVTLKNILWRDDFSYMRNESIKLCKTPWLLIIDADETITFRGKFTAKNLRDELPKIRAAGYESAAVTLNDWHGKVCSMRCGSARFFSPNVRYSGIIHNAPKIKGDSALIQHVDLNHYGYALEKARMDAKFERTYNSLMKQLKDNPEEPHTEFYLCQLYGTRGMPKESEEWGDKYIERHKYNRDVLNPTVYYSLARIALSKKKVDKAKSLVKEGLARTPQDPDLLLVMSDIQLQEGQLFDMAMSARNYVQSYMKLNNTGVSGKFFFSLRPDVLSNAYQRICMGYTAEAMSAGLAMMLTPECPPQIKEGMKKQLEVWGLGSVWEALDDRAKKHRKTGTVS